MCVFQSVLTGFTFKFSLAVAQAGAAHHLTVLSVAIPLLADAVVIVAVMTPLWRRAEKVGREREREKEGLAGAEKGEGR